MRSDERVRAGAWRVWIAGAGLLLVAAGCGGGQGGGDPGPSLDVEVPGEVELPAGDVGGEEVDASRPPVDACEPDSGSVCCRVDEDCKGRMVSQGEDACNAATCVDGWCVVEALEDGAPCSDDDACTDGDRCESARDGVRCVAVGAVDCDDGNACTDDGCDPVAGCTHADNALACAAARCESGSFYAAATCVAGGCPAQVAVPCDDGNACTDDGCDPVAGCTHADNVLACAAARCESGSFYAAASCVAGGCPAQVAVPCDDGNACTDDGCDPVAGCTHADNVLACAAARCESGSFYAAASCVAGGCPAQVAVPCDDGNACTDDGCDPVVGCTHADNALACAAARCESGVFYAAASCVAGGCPAQAAVPCDDGNACTDDGCDPVAGCTHADNALACAAARCESGSFYAAASCVAGGCPAQVAVPCDDGNACTDDGCDPVAGCTHADNALACAAARCESGVFYAAESCAAGECPAQAAIPCDDGNACTDDGCDPLSGCTHADNALPCADARCESGVFYAAESCAAGECPAQAAVPCDDGNACTDDGCDPLSGCTHADNVLPCADARCESGVFYAAESCAAGECPAQAAIPCDDGNACTDDGCDLLSGCTHADNALPCADARCESGVFYAAESCAAGECPAQAAIPCDDGNPCTDDTCDPSTGCTHTDNTLPCASARCEGGSFYPAESCAAGECPTQVAVPCDDANACTDDTCELPTGCTHTDNTLPCADARCESGSFYPAESCSAGECPAQVAVSCDDGNACTDDVCDLLAGCGHQDNSLPCAEARCEGDDFYAAESCASGSCPVQQAVRCDDGNPCTDDDCDPVKGCTFVDNALPCAQARCEGGSYYAAESCAEGECPVQQAVACDDGNPCTDDACDPLAGCTHATVADDTPCLDGVFCNGAEACAAGACVAAVIGPCDDGDPDTLDTCDEGTGACRHDDIRPPDVDRSLLVLDRWAAGYKHRFRGTAGATEAGARIRIYAGPGKTLLLAGVEATAAADGSIPEVQISDSSLAAAGLVHSDLVTAWISATDAAGNESEALEPHDQSYNVGFVGKTRGVADPVPSEAFWQLSPALQPAPSSFTDEVCTSTYADSLGGMTALPARGWRKLSTPELSAHALAYDGTSPGGALMALGDSGPYRFTDDWRYAATNPSPAPNQQSVATYDSLRNRLVLYGGLCGNQTWEWDGVAWSEVVTQHRPPALTYRGNTYNDGEMAFDPVRGVAVLVVGKAISAAGCAGTVWHFDGVDWTDESPAGSVCPSSGIGRSRWGFALSWDGVNQKVLLFGGTHIGGGIGSSKNDTWHWDGNSWTQLAPGTSPASRTDAVAAWDANRQRVVLYGGNDSAYSGGTGTDYSDTWEWTGTNWTRRVTSSLPGARMSTRLVYHEVLGKTFLLGGSCVSEACNGQNMDFWAWDGTTWTNAKQTPAPAGRKDHGMAFDSSRGVAVLFGGLNAAGSKLGDTWEWNGTAWSKRSPAAAPTARHQATMVYDGARNQTVLFGGMAASISSETWIWDGTNWTRPSPAARPLARQGAAMAYDGDRQVVVLFGGFTGGFNAETWTWDGSNWTDMAPAHSPPRRAYSAMAFDPVRGRTLLFGGWDGSTELGDMWEWDGVDWTELTPAVRPAAIRNHTLAWDQSVQRVVLWTGVSAGYVVNSHWEWDGERWYGLDMAPAWYERAGAAVVYDSLRGHLFGFGGGYTGVAFEDSWVSYSNSALVPNFLVDAVAESVPLDEVRDVTLTIQAGGDGFDAVESALAGLDAFVWESGAWERVAGNASSAGSPSSINVTFPSIPQSVLDEGRVRLLLSSRGPSGVLLPAAIDVHFSGLRFRYFR